MFFSALDFISLDISLNLCYLDTANLVCGEVPDTQKVCISRLHKQVLLVSFRASQVGFKHTHLCLSALYRYSSLSFASN